MRRVTFLVLVALGCNKKEEVTYEQFNAEDDTVDIEVGVEKALPAVTTELHSTTGEVIVGTAEVDPGGGPIGTEHEIVVIVVDDYEEIVDRVTVRTYSPDRGKDEYELEPDSADEGYYKKTLVSVGQDDEVRTDTLTFRLWDVEGDDDAEGAEDDSATEE
jgi:hypothetical protein